MKKVDKNKINAFELVCCWRLLNLKWLHYISNEVILQRTNPDNWLLHQVKNIKISLFSHKCRINNNRLIKTVVTGITWDKKERGRPTIKQISNIKEWCDRNISGCIHCIDQWRFKYTYTLSTTHTLLTKIKHKKLRFLNLIWCIYTKKECYNIIAVVYINDHLYDKSLSDFNILSAEISIYLIYKVRLEKANMDQLLFAIILFTKIVINDNFVYDENLSSNLKM